MLMSEWNYLESLGNGLFCWDLPYCERFGKEEVWSLCITQFPQGKDRWFVRGLGADSNGNCTGVSRLSRELEIASDRDALEWFIKYNRKKDDEVAKAVRESESASDAKGDK